MKKFTLLWLIAGFLPFLTSAQQLTPVSLPVCGGYYTAGGVSLSTTIGQPFYKTLKASNTLTLGFQQPEWDLKLIPDAEPACIGDSLTLTYVAKGVISPFNTFSFQLSDKWGLFSAPTVLATTTGTHSGSIKVHIADAVEASDYYKFRMLATGANKFSPSTDFYTIQYCRLNLNLQAFIQGFYAGAETMTSALLNSGLGSDPTEADSITVALYAIEDLSVEVAAVTTILHTNGLASCEFPASTYGHGYYVVIRHRNSIETWSKDPVWMLSRDNNFDFAH